MPEVPTYLAGLVLQLAKVTPSGYLLLPPAGAGLVEIHHGAGKVHSTLVPAEDVLSLAVSIGVPTIDFRAHCREAYPYRLLTLPGIATGRTATAAFSPDEADAISLVEAAPYFTDAGAMITRLNAGAHPLAALSIWSLDYRRIILRATSKLHRVLDDAAEFN